MSIDHLPDCVDFRRLAARQTQLDGVVALAQLQRLSAQMTDSAGVATVSLLFCQDDERRSLVQGQVSACLHVRCQRCLQPMPLPVTQAFRLAAVYSDEQARQLPDDCDPWLIGDEPLRLADLVEEELLLALPIVSFHEDCQSLAPTQAAEAAMPAPARDNPFQALAKLKTGPQGQ